MRDLISCYNEQAIRVSDSSCSGSGSSAGSAVSPPDRRRPLLSSVTTVHRTLLSSKAELLVTLTWSTALHGQGLAATVAGEHLLLRKRRGSRALAAGYAVHWDISAARYGAGPEPADGFYVAVVAGGELALLLGDARPPESVRALPLAAAAELVSRRESVSGGLRQAYATRARLGGCGEHEVSVARGGEEMEVRVDGAEVVRVRRLRWNFRGNCMIFVGGAAVDVMWDVHDWWFGGGRGGVAVLMFRERKAAESRLWMEEGEEAAARPPNLSLSIYSLEGI